MLIEQELIFKPEGQNLLKKPFRAKFHRENDLGLKSVGILAFRPVKYKTTPFHIFHALIPSTSTRTEITR